MTPEEPCTSTYIGAVTHNTYRCGDFEGHKRGHETSDGAMWWTDAQAAKPEPEPEPEATLFAEGTTPVLLTAEQILVIGGALSLQGEDLDERMLALKATLYTALVGLMSNK